MSNIRVQSSNTQRALVMQGGSSLGAYEAGVFKALYHKLPHKDNENRVGEEEKDKALF